MNGPLGVHPRSDTYGATATSSVVAGYVRFQAVAKLTLTAETGALQNIRFVELI